MPSWKKVIVSGSDATLNSLLVSGNTIISGSLAVGTSSIGPSENTITLGARDNASEGGQIGFNAPGGTYTSASFIDNWQNKARILKGNNTTSTGLIAQWDIHTTQMQLPGYTAASSFPGTPAGYLAFDTSGNLLTVAGVAAGAAGTNTQVQYNNGGLLAGTPIMTITSPTVQISGSTSITGSLTATNAVIAQANGAMYFRGGDDAELWDINISNHLGIYGQQDATVSTIKLGSGGGTISGKSGNIGIGTINPTSASLTVNGNVFATSFTGSGLLITGSTTTDLVRITQTGTGNAFVVEDSANPDTSSFTISNAGNVGIGIAPDINYKLYAVGGNIAAIAGGGAGYGVQGTGTQVGVYGAVDGNLLRGVFGNNLYGIGINAIGVDGQAINGVGVRGTGGVYGGRFSVANDNGSPIGVYASVAGGENGNGTGVYIGGKFEAPLSDNGPGGMGYTGYSVQLRDGTEAIGKVLVSQDASGSANWSTRLSGSYEITGSLRVTAGITGSLQGTASFAITSSYVTASNVFGPYGSNSVISSSYAIYAATASYSTNASDILIYVKNTTGTQINKGTVVRITGATGDNALIETASYESDSVSANTLGITNENIANDAFGYVITEGRLIGINTNLWTAGQLLFLGANGSITGSAPLAPLHAVRLGQVLRVQTNNGSMYVRINNGYELNELHDVTDNTTTASYGDLLVKSGSVWTNSRQLTGSYALTGSLTVTGSTTSDLVRITQTGTGNAFVVEDSANPDSSPFVVDATGNVGIGTSFPSASLHINNTSTSASFLVEDSTNPDTTPFVIDTNGNVGMGTLTPQNVLHVKANPTSTGTATIRVESDAVSANSSISYYSSGVHRWEAGTGISLGAPYEIYDRVAGQTRFSITTAGASVFSTGNVGIGTTTPNSKLDVNGDTIITGSLTVTNDFRVLGSASIQYITSSQLNIADNIISVNTITPAVRFGGLTVIDSGSSPQQSGSMLFDSQNNQWIFVHQSAAGAAVTSSALIMGPQTFNNIGNETTLTANRLAKAVGGDLGEHVGDSNITDTGTLVSINSNTEVTGSLAVSGSLRVGGIIFGDGGTQLTGATSINGSTSMTGSLTVTNDITGSGLLINGSASINGGLTITSPLATYNTHTVNSFDFDIYQNTLNTGNVFRVNLWDGPGGAHIPVIDAGAYKLNTINPDTSGTSLTSIDWKNRKLFDSDNSPGGPNVVLDWNTTKTVKVSGSLLVTGSATIIGDTTITGSLTVTDKIKGTSSHIDTNALIQASLLYLSNNF